MSEGKRRRFGKALKLEVVWRMESGESATALSQEYGISRTIMYYWRDVVRERGEEGLRDGPGRPTRLEALANPRGPAARPLLCRRRAGRSPSSSARLASSRRTGFFKAALRHFEETRRPATGGRDITSSPGSRRRRGRKAKDR